MILVIIVALFGVCALHFYETGWTAGYKQARKRYKKKRRINVN